MGLNLPNEQIQRKANLLGRFPTIHLVLRPTPLLHLAAVFSNDDSSICDEFSPRFPTIIFLDLTKHILRCSKDTYMGSQIFHFPIFLFNFTTHFCSFSILHPSMNS